MQWVCAGISGGATDGYLVKLMEGNPVVFNGVALKDLIINKWKSAPVTGEAAPGSFTMTDLDRQVKLFHPVSFGNGNFGAKPTGDVATRVRTAFANAGYRFNILTGTIKTGAAGSITVVLNNFGITPTYENWNIVYQLKNSTGTQVWTGTSTTNLKLLQPGALTITDQFNIPNGSYTLTVKITDPTGYRQPMPLAQGNRNADGSYTLK